MRDELRILGVDLLTRLLGLLAGVFMLVAFWFLFPAYMDIQSGRVTFAEASNHIWLGIGAAIGFLIYPIHFGVLEGGKAARTFGSKEQSKGAR